MGERWPIAGSCSLGRSPTNQVVLADIKVSRRHALINCQSAYEYWLVDLGSSNGTYLNARRVSQPTRLQDNDRIAIGDFLVVFHQPQAMDTGQEHTLTEMTIQQIRTAQYWLLVVDLIDSTQLSQKLSSEALSVVTGRWLARCKEIVEGRGGCINKFLGDGLLAYWPEAESAAAAVTQAIREFKALQAEENPRFRVVIHHGEVAVGGSATMGEESLVGKEVNYVFRLEKLASGLSNPCLMSSAAQARLKSLLPTTEAGRHPLAGFEEPQLVFEF
jgi:adenylate cyclase